MPDTENITEIWRAVVGYEGLYEVSNLGRVRRVVPKTRILAPQSQGKYLKVSLSRNGKVRQHYIHALVLAAFVGPRPPGQETNHKDAKKGRNPAENLEYLTHLENVRHAKRLGLLPTGAHHGSSTHPESILRGTKRPNAKLTNADVLAIRRFASSGMRHALIAVRFNVAKSTIGNITSGRKWKHV